MATSMGKTAQTMAKMNKQMNPQKMAKTLGNFRLSIKLAENFLLAQFERENMKMDGMEEMMNDAMGKFLLNL